MEWTKKIPKEEIQDKITDVTVCFAEEFGRYLATSDDESSLTTSQLRKFFGEVKRQQMNSYEPTKFIMLKPKLAYAVGRAKASGKGGNAGKIKYFYEVIVDAIDKVACAGDLEKQEKAFKNFITFFEAIVAYHKATGGK